MYLCGPSSYYHVYVADRYDQPSLRRGVWVGSYLRGSGKSFRARTDKGRKIKGCAGTDSWNRYDGFYLGLKNENNRKI